MDQIDAEVEINYRKSDGVDRGSSEIMSIVDLSSFEAFQGYVDHISASRLSGWAICTKSLKDKVMVSLWLGDLRVLACRADRYRVDLELVGSGDGECAFEMEVPEFMHRHFQAKDEVLSLRLSCGKFEFELADDAALRRKEPSEGARMRVVDALRQFMVHKFEIFGSDKVLEYKRAALSPLKDRLECLHRRADSAIFDGVGNEKTIHLSPYSIHTRDRLRLERDFDVENNPLEAENLLAWYVEHYAIARKGLRVPLSREEIEHCNTMLYYPGCAFQLSKLHMQRLLRDNRALALGEVLADETAYRREVFAWVDSTVKVAGVEDVLVPRHYVEFLRTVRSHWLGKQFGLNDFLECKHGVTPSWHSFDLANNVDRGCLMLVALLQSVDDPTIARFVGENERSLIFDPGEDAQPSFFVQLLKHLKDEVLASEFEDIDMEATISGMLAEKGYDISRDRWLTVNASGDRRHFQFKSKDDIDDLHCELQLIGPVSKASGLGQATRLSALSLKQAGFSPNIYDFNLDNPAPDGYSSHIEHTTLKRSKINLLHLNAESIPTALAYMPDVFSDSYNIGYFYWELDSPAKCHKLALDFLDEIWVSTDYGVMQYETATDRPVVNVGMTVEEHVTPEKKWCRKKLNNEFGIGENETVFLTTFDSFSFVQRKNPLAVIKAFREAFVLDEPVRLLLKTQNRTRVFDPVQRRIWQSVDKLIENDPRVLLVDKTFKYDDLLAFKKAADCYVSLHRSEGWGFGMIESMLLGVPVIATDYSGNLEFCKPDHCWLVESQEVFLGADDYIFVKPGQKWADPCVSDAARCFRDAHLSSEKRLKFAQRATDYIREHFGNKAIANRYGERLRAIVDSLDGTQDRYGKFGKFSTVTTHTRVK